MQKEKILLLVSENDCNLATDAPLYDLELPIDMVASK